MQKNSETPKLHQDFKDIIKLCNQHSIKYVIVGGFAVSIHGYPRGTKDLDICIEASEENAGKMVAVLKEFGMGSLGFQKDDFIGKEKFAQFGYEPVRIDIMTEIDGLPFDKVWQNKRTITYQEQVIHFIGYHELLQMKEIAGRPQDIADIAKLKARNKDKQ